MKTSKFLILSSVLLSSLAFGSEPKLTPEHMNLIANTGREELFQKMVKDKKLASIRLGEFLEELRSIEKEKTLNKKAKFCVKVGLVKECEVVENVTCFKAMNSALNTLGVGCNS